MRALPEEEQSKGKLLIRARHSLRDTGRGPATPAAREAAASLAERPRSWRSYRDFVAARHSQLRSASRQRLQV